MLVPIADKHFLVTAAHHLIALHITGLDGFLVQREQGSHPVLIATEKWYSTTSEEANLAVCQLDPHLVNYLGSKHKFLRITDFVPKQHYGVRDGDFFVLKLYQLHETTYALVG